ncbi:MAG TPA: hypothetical protein VIL53_08200 [Solirubrobacterales bacterium]
MSAWKLTIRHGSDVVREQFDSLEQAIEELRRLAEAIRSEGPLDRVGSLRDFEPAEQVHARLEISTGGLLRGRDAGLDLMGDGTLVPYRGGIRRTQLELRDGQNPFDAVGEALTGASR